jgi:hypothetical protein
MGEAGPLADLDAAIAGAERIVAGIGAIDRLAAFLGRTV